ncbi:sensor histidine kinase [Methylobacter tundripaludum]|uniref:histidine kinase n=1 Tax=Methylobacter tundripaludum (strain ATCC BAA-1195 / DSM 17260 / SV96) TaxID=697282 RepID=G3IXS3_METTV|nr:7TM-DISM domain-containing protein [Methylobacter tundripaludum]EGW23482.1 ATP-binding region ATPase domain protein [Methylobacter tundripaludum SV96]
MRFCFQLLLWIFGLSLSAAASGNDLVISRAFLVDPAGALSIDQVTLADFQPAGPMLSQGYTEAVHWIRLSVKAPDHGDTVELRIRPAFLDEVRLYESDAASPGGWKTRVTGDRYSYQDRDRAAVTLAFVVRPQAPQTVYYLRLKTAGISRLYVEALPSRVAQREDLKLIGIQVVYLGVMLWLLSWAIHDYAMRRDSITGWFVLSLLVHIFHNLAVMGYLAPFLPPQAAPLGDMITSLLVVGALLSAMLFHRSLLRLYMPPKLLMFVLNVLIGLSLLELAAIAGGYPRPALQANNAVVVVVFPALFLALAFTLRQEAVPSRFILRTFYCMGTFPTVLPMLGWVDAVTWTLYAAQVHGLLSGGLMFLILNLRSRQLLREGQKASLDLELAQQHLHLERSQKEEQGRFMVMLTHELKTPMSVVRLSLDAMKMKGPLKNHADRALEDMNDIVERCQQVDQLEQHRLIIRPQPCRMDDILSDLKQNSWAPDRLLTNTEPLPDINTDPQLLRIVLGNLTSNAIKYAAPLTDIEMTAIFKQRQARFGILITILNQPGAAGLPDPERVFQKY